MKSRAVILVVAALLMSWVACEREPEMLVSYFGPPPPLSPQLPALQRIADELPAAPDEARAAALAELVDGAFSAESDEWLRKRAERSLLRDDQLRFALEEGLLHPETAVRSQCAWQLAELGDPASIPTLLWRWRIEVEYEPRAWIILALARLGTYAPLPTLADMLEDPASQQYVVGAADQVLLLTESMPAERTWTAMADALRAVHQTWFDARIERGKAGAEPDPPIDPALRAELAALMIKLNDFRLRGVDQARTALHNVTQVPLDLLRMGLIAEETYLRVHTTEIVRDLGLVAAPLGPDVARLLDDPSARMAAIEAVGELRHVPARKALLGFLIGDDPELAVVAAKALGPLGDAAAIAPLREALRDEGRSRDVRVHAAYSLALLAPASEGLVYLRERLKNADYHEPTLRELIDRVESSVRE